jgi:hypothetical protein
MLDIRRWKSAVVCVPKANSLAQSEYFGGITPAGKLGLHLILANYAQSFSQQLGVRAVH